GVGVGVEEMGDFAVAELLGGFGLEEVVDSCGSAAERGLGDLGELESGDGAQEFARLEEDSLSVAKAACVVIGDAERERVARGERLEVGEDFSDVAAFCGE